MDKQRWPPLNCLRGFRAAARLGSFSRAAETLHMTQSAVSHQIKTLESYLDLDLFIREKRRVVLTDAGRALLETTEACLETLDRGFRRVDQYRKPNQLILHTDSAFASNWLVDRLTDFRKRQPGIDVWLYTTDAEPDMDLTEVHYAILKSQPDSADIHSEPLLPDLRLPVCAASHPIMQRDQRGAEDLLEHDLLHGEDEPGWAQWFETAGLKNVRPVAGPNFSNAAHMLQAAESGAGIALVSLVQASAALESGRLANPISMGLRCEQDLCLVERTDGLKSDRMPLFRDWLLDAVEDFRRQSLEPWMRELTF